VPARPAAWSPRAADGATTGSGPARRPWSLAFHSRDGSRRCAQPGAALLAGRTAVHYNLARRPGRPLDRKGRSTPPPTSSRLGSVEAGEAQPKRSLCTGHRKTQWAGYLLVPRCATRDPEVASSSQIMDSRRRW
jgi:hypothetical protein